MKMITRTSSTSGESSSWSRSTNIGCCRMSHSWFRSVIMAGGHTGWISAHARPYSSMERSFDSSIGFGFICGRSR